jgi:hypothetical protein
MRAVTNIVLLAAAPLAIAACHKQQQPQDQNVAVDQDPMNGGLPANAQIETLPADESSTTPSNELANGSDNADVDATNASGNSY